MGNDLIKSCLCHVVKEIVWVAEVLKIEEREEKSATLSRLSQKFLKRADFLDRIEACPNYRDQYGPEQPRKRWCKQKFTILICHFQIFATAKFGRDLRD